MTEFFDGPEWKELSQSCLGCGTCTFVCPTCQCYDIKDFNTGHGIQSFPLLGFVYVFRLHEDVCGTAETYSAGAFPSAVYAQARVLTRPITTDSFSCVGCGRCVSQSCPIHMNIVKVMKKLGGRSDD